MEETVIEPIPIAGLFETHLTVSDLSRSIAFYRDIVGLTLALEVPERGAAFFWIGPPGHAMLGLWSLGSAQWDSPYTSPSKPASTTSLRRAIA